MAIIFLRLIAGIVIGLAIHAALTAWWNPRDPQDPEDTTRDDPDGDGGLQFID